MPNLKLKPWKVNEPQVVWLSNTGCRRIVVSYGFVDSYEGKPVCQRYIHFEYIATPDAMGTERWGNDRSIDDGWQEEFVNLLGIPETIEGEG